MKRVTGIGGIFFKAKDAPVDAFGRPWVVIKQRHMKDAAGHFLHRAA